MKNSEPVKNQSQISLNQVQIQTNKNNTSINNISESSQGNMLKNINQNQNPIQTFPNQVQNQIINTNQNQINNAINTSTNLSFHESQSSFQNPNNFILKRNLSNTSGSANFPTKEYFNFQFFKRQMSSQSSDFDFCGENKEFLNDFFAARLNSILSKDSSKQQSNIFKNSVDRISCDLDLNRENLSTNLENKEEQSQAFLTRANSASQKKCSNYVPKTFYFQRNNSNTPSCFYKKNINNNNNINNEKNLLLRYYGNNGEYNLNNNNINKNKFLDVINDKDDENEEDDMHEIHKINDEDEEESDECILTNKEDDNFSINYLNRKSQKDITLPKRTFTLVHRTSSQLLNNDNNLSLRKNSDLQGDKNGKENIDKKKLPPVKTNTFCPSSKNNLDFDDDNEIKDKMKKNKNIDKENQYKDDSECMNESKSNTSNDNINENHDEDKNKNEKNKNINNENKDSNDLSDVPDFSELKNFKTKKDIDSNDNSQNEEDNNEISDYFFSKKNNLNNINPNQNQNLNNISSNINLQNNLLFNNNNKNNNIQHQLNKNSNINISTNPNLNIYPQNINSLQLMMAKQINKPNNNFSLSNENQLLQEMKKLNLNNNYMNDFNNLNPQLNYMNNNYPINQMINSTDDFLKNASNYIKDQTGCRFIQKKIDENPMISNNLFEILYQDLCKMSRDLFGNYVVQKILENINSKYLIQFIELISNDFINLSISTYGTRVIQKLLEIVTLKKNTNINTDKEIHEQCFKLLNNYITDNIVELSSNNNSSHIIIKYVNEIKYPKNVQLFNEIYKNFIPLCKDKHGCCVIQKCIEFGSQEQKKKLLELNNLHCENLINDQFGNYVLQFVVSLNLKIVNQKVYQVLKNNLCNLCKEKYASNVIEKFLVNKSEESFEIIDSLLKDEKLLHELIIDQFGNYIIQRILVLIDGEKRSLLIHYIVNWYPEIKALSFGPRLISKLHERYQEFTILVTQNYGWDTTQETVSYLHLNGSKLNNNNNNNYNKNNYNNNINVNSFNNSSLNNNGYFGRANNISQMFQNYGNNIMGNRTNNNNCMNFKNKNNVGNINFIQMNNYMLSPGLNNQNNTRLSMNNRQLYSNFNNNINNLKNMNIMNPGINTNNINFQREQQQNYFNVMNNNLNNNLIQKINNFGTNNNANINPFNMQFNNNMGNNNQNMINYQQYLNMTFPNIKK